MYSGLPLLFKKVLDEKKKDIYEGNSFSKLK